jgi:hypothetical protein
VATLFLGIVINSSPKQGPMRGHAPHPQYTWKNDGIALLRLQACEFDYSGTQACKALR